MYSQVVLKRSKDNIGLDTYSDSVVNKKANVVNRGRQAEGQRLDYLYMCPNDLRQMLLYLFYRS